MYRWDIFEGRYHPIPMGRPQFDTIPNVKMVGIVLQLTKSIWSTGKAVIMDSGLCDLKGIL